ncbi:protein FAM161A [Ctenodactylus gundi]
MASSHREAKLVVASLHLPVDPNTGARVAHYEREDPVEALAAATAHSDGEDRKVPRASVVPGGPGGAGGGLAADFNADLTGVDGSTVYDDFVKFSEMCHSNEEYFKKLEELKAAHIETMAKLEKLYQNKLSLRDIQPVIIREDASSVSSSPASGKGCPRPAGLTPPLLEPEAGPPSCWAAWSWDGEPPALGPARPGPDRAATWARELIGDMWAGFRVEDYTRAEDARFRAPGKSRRKPKAWVPAVTVPVPFRMTVREQKKKDEAVKAKSGGKMAPRPLRKDDDAECRKRFRAHPVPAHVLRPLDRDAARRSAERGRAALLAAVAGDEPRRAARDKQLGERFRPKKKSERFKARPVPPSTYGPTVSHGLKQEPLGQSRPQPGARELPPAPPRASPGCVWSPAGSEQAGKPRCEPRAEGWTPDAERLTEKPRRYSEPGCPKLAAVREPPAPRASSRAAAEGPNILANEENLKEARHTCSPKRKSPGRSRRARPKPCPCSPPAPTVASRVRERAVRRSLEEQRMLEEERKRILTKQKQRMKELQKLLTTRAEAYDPHQSLAQMSKSKVEYLRKIEKERMREYRRELEEREEKLKKRPLLFERVAQKNARMAAEKHYSNTLKALGISDEFVSNKGYCQKVFEHFSNQEMKSLTEDMESYNEEEKLEDKENGEDNYVTDTNSQDSCKDKDEDEGSGEASVEE